MKNRIASTVTVHTLVTHSTARPLLTPEQRLFLALSCAAWVPTPAGHPLLPFPLQLRAQHCNLQQGDSKWWVAFRAVWITSHGVLWGDVSPAHLLSGPQVRLQLHYCIPCNHWKLQQGQRRAEGTNSFPAMLRRHFLHKTAANFVSALQLFCSSLSSEGKCQVLLREQEAFRVTYGGEQLREK